jgi:hypothetical protein
MVISVTPTEAQVTVDGVPIPSAPRVVVAPEGTRVRVRATAPGYRPRELELHVRAGTTVGLALDPAPHR